nr:uncharacterized protein LOC113807664 isoform X1 [Penaeus vannamei]
MNNCTVDHDLAMPFLAYIAVSAIIYAAGTLCNLACVWCLVHCSRTSIGMKVQLGCFFGLLLVQCAVSDPLVMTSLTSGFFCGSLQPAFRACTLIFGNIVVDLERCHFAAMAVYRLLAVRWPFVYKRACELRKVVVSEVVMAISATVTWVVPLFLKKLELEDLSFLTGNGKGNPQTYSTIRLLFGLGYFVPLGVSLVSYVAIMITIVQRRRKLQTRDSLPVATARRDQLHFIIQVILVTFILIDVPHTVIHQIYSVDIRLASYIIHFIFSLHLIIDPMIFIGLNQNYRERLVECIIPRHCRCKKQKIAAEIQQVEQELTHPSVTSRMPS